MSRTRDNRIVFMMSGAEMDMLERFRHSRKIGSRAEAIRQLVAEGLSGAESKQQFLGRLSEMPPAEAAREACGHPLVARIVLLPDVAIHLTDGTEVAFSEGKQA